MTTLPPHDSDASNSNRDRICGEGFSVFCPDTLRIEIGDKLSKGSKPIARFKTSFYVGPRRGRTVMVKSIEGVNWDPSRERTLIFGSAVDLIPSSIANSQNHKCLGDMACLEMLEINLRRGGDFIDSIRLHSSVGQLKNLKHFSCTNTSKLSELPKEIGDITSLEKLQLHNTAIKSLPSSIGKLKNLKHLSLYSNKAISDFPEEIGDITGLETLDLSSCTMKSLPRRIVELKNLQKLSLSGCRALLELPEEIGKLHKLTDLNLSETDKLQELPPSIGQLQNLRILSLHDAIPPSIGNFQNVIYLTISRKNLITLARSLTNSEALPRLESIFFNGDRTPQWTPLEYEHLLIIAKRCMSLGFISTRFRRFPKKETHDLGCVLSRNRARSRFLRLKQVQIAPALWPHMIQNATSASTPDRIKQMFSSFPNSITRPDAIYQLLTDNRESFLSFLFHRKNATMPENDVSGLK